MKAVPSRELDALVAEKVMGWELKFVGAPSYVWTERETGLGRAHEDHWSPSTSIHYTWQVVEKLGMVTIENQKPSGHWSVGFTSHDSEGEPHWVHAEADTAPLAICLAALKAVGVDVESPK